METATTKAAEVAAPESSTGETTSAHASPSTKAVRPRGPTAETTESVAKAAERIRSAEAAFITTPGSCTIRAQTIIIAAEIV